MTSSPSPTATVTYRCPNCGGAVSFDVHTQTFTCTSCKSEVRVTPAKNTVEEYSLNDYTMRERAGAPVTGVAVVQCQSCGGEIYFEENETAARCPMCGSASIRTGVASSGIAPEGVVPFRFDRFDAQERFRKWIVKRWFAPNALKKSFAEGALEGMYVPFWTYDADTCADYVGMGGRWRERYNRGKKEASVEWFRESGRVFRQFDDLLVCASRNQSGGLVQQVLPYDTVNDIRPFAHPYLAGYKAERYSIDGMAGFETARATIEGALQQDAHADILARGYSTARVQQVAVKYRNVTYKNVLLPLYLAHYGYGGKQYHYAINGETGKVSAQYPKSPWKIALVALLAALFFLLVFWLVGGEDDGYSPGYGYYGGPFGGTAPVGNVQQMEASPLDAPDEGYQLDFGGPGAA